ncbi:hypothetical protein BASA81_005346 [Batrachochytrium salamandrivorans]|nr:hypothetical protein BASA81_005346 [Batrachochytrium salamandrivorans]
MTEQEDEATRLTLANERLREELAGLKLQVESLRERRFEQEEEASNEGGGMESNEDRLLRLENALLKAQLREQSNFLLGCRELMERIPELKASTSGDLADGDNAKREEEDEQTAKLREEELMKQGAENAMTHLLLLVSRSQTCNDWQAVQLPEHCFRSAVPGFNVTCNFRKEERDPVNRPGEITVCLRVDSCFPNISPDAVAATYWSTWTNVKSMTTIFHAFFGVSKPGGDVDPPTPFIVSELMQGQSFTTEGGEEHTKVNLYRQLDEQDEELRDWIYCMTKQRREIAMSTLNMNPELNPSVAARRVQHTRRVMAPGTNVPTRKRGKGCTSSSQLMGRQECIVLARTCMRGQQRKALSALSANQTIAEDGLFAWQDEVSIDFEVDCAEGKELQRKRVPAARASSFIAFPMSKLVVHDTDLYPAILDASGKATEKYAKLIDMYYGMMGL